MVSRLSAAQESAPKLADDAPILDLSSYMPTWMLYRLFGIALWQYVAAFVFVLVGLVAKVVASHLLKKIAERDTGDEKPRFNQLLTAAAMKPFAWLLFLGGIAGAVGSLTLPVQPDVRGTVFGTLRVLLVTDFIWFLFRIVDVIVVYLSRLATRTESTLDDQLVPMLSKALKITLLLLCFVWVLQLLGYNVSSLIAGLGIGGLAVALALQDTLSNFFGSIFVFLDKPFAPGDWIKVGGVEGTVEEIGFRSTRIRSWPKSLISVPNKTVASSVIDNWSKMPLRRVYQNVLVTYDATPAQMDDALAAIKKLIGDEEDVDKGFYLIRFTDFEESGLNIMLYYFTKSLGWDAHLATKEKINLAIMRILEERGMKLAVPARDVTVSYDDTAAKPELKKPPTSQNKSRRSRRNAES
jgi:MscS family membrane protein